MAFAFHLLKNGRKLESLLHNVKKTTFGSGHLLPFSDKNYTENVFKTPHNYMYNCSSVAGVRREYSLSPTEKDSQMAIVPTKKSLSQGWDGQPQDREISFLSQYNTSLGVALIQD